LFRLMMHPNLGMAFMHKQYLAVVMARGERCGEGAAGGQVGEGGGRDIGLVQQGADGPHARPVVVDLQRQGTAPGTRQTWNRVD
jgi:hypothetical protein